MKFANREACLAEWNSYVGSVKEDKQIVPISQPFSSFEAFVQFAALKNKGGLYAILQDGERKDNLSKRYFAVMLSELVPEAKIYFDKRYYIKLNKADGSVINNYYKILDLELCCGQKKVPIDLKKNIDNIDKDMHKAEQIYRTDPTIKFTELVWSSVGERAGANYADLESEKFLGHVKYFSYLYIAKTKENLETEDYDARSDFEEEIRNLKSFLESTLR